MSTSFSTTYHQKSILLQPKKRKADVSMQKKFYSKSYSLLPTSWTREIFSSSSSHNYFGSSTPVSQFEYCLLQSNLNIVSKVQGLQLHCHNEVNFRLLNGAKPRRACGRVCSLPLNEICAQASQTQKKNIMR